MIQTAQDIVEVPQAHFINSCDATPSDQPSKHLKSHRLSASDSESPADRGGPSGAMSEILDVLVPQTVQEKTVEVVKADSAGAGFGTNCGADRTRAGRDSTSAGSAAGHSSRGV